MKKIYPARKSFVKYDDDHFLLYLGEQKIEDYHRRQTLQVLLQTTSPRQRTRASPPSATRAQSQTAPPRLQPSQQPTMTLPQVWFAPNTAKTRSRPSCATMAMAMRSTKRSMTPSRLGASKPRRWLMRCLRERSN